MKTAEDLLDQRALQTVGHPITAAPRATNGDAASTVLPPALVPEVRVETICMADVAPQAVAWLWPGRVPRGKLTLLEGDPGLGKSTLTIELAARVTTGRALPGAEPAPPASVLFVTYEDGLADTLVPRLIAAGADLSRVFALQGIAYGSSPERLLRIPDDVGAIAAEIVRCGATLVIIDPLGAALSTDRDSYKDADARSALAPLARAAEETGAAIILVRHLTKGAASRAIAAGGGSIGFAAAARSVLAVHVDPKDPSRRVLAVVKNNLAPHPPSLAFSLEDDGSGSARVVWQGSSTYTAEELNSARGNAAQEPNENESDAWLRELLSEGPRERRDLMQLAKGIGFNERTVDRAKKRLGVVAALTGFGTEKRSSWSIPSGPPAGNGTTPAAVAKPRRTVDRDGTPITEELRPTAHGDRWVPVEGAP